MMPNVTRGDRMAGLLTYLAGGGKRNEHSEPHVVAGDNAIMAWYADNELDRDSALAIARHLDKPQKRFGTEVSRGHVWHCSLSLRAEEGLLPDEKWNAIARDFMTLMDFDDAEGTKAPLRWVAVRHGVSQNGNDHIHIAVNLVREDGTKANVHLDWPRAQKAARALEVKYGLQTLESVNAERSTRGYDPGEREAQGRQRARAKYERRLRAGEQIPQWYGLDAAERNGMIVAEMQADEPRLALARTVRGCATASLDEGEFVRRMRRAGLLVRPRFAEGTQDVITGYSVARRPDFGERAIWYGGGHLGRDLTLPRLRTEWPDTPQGASTAAAEWNAAKRQRRAAEPGRELLEPSPELTEQLNKDLSRLRENLRGVPIDDRETWARVARHTAGAFAAWSRAVEETPGDLAHVADVLSRSAQTWHRPVKPKPAGLASVGAAAMVLAMTASGAQNSAAQMVMIRMLGNLAKAVFDAAKAGGDLRQAEAIRSAAKQQLEAVHSRLEQQVAVMERVVPVAPIPSPEPTPVSPEIEAMLARLQAANASASERAQSPIPNKLPERTDSQRSTATTDRGEGTER